MHDETKDFNIHKKFKLFRILIVLIGFILFCGLISTIFLKMEDVVYGDGELTGIYDYELKSLVASTITELGKDEGDAVSKGDIILRLDNRELLDKMDLVQSIIGEMEAEIEVKKTSLDVLRNDPLPTYYRHISTELEECRKKFEKSNAKMPIYRKLFEKMVISRVEFEKIEIEYIQNKAALERAEADFARVNKGLEDKIVKNAETQLKLLEVKLENKRKEFKSLENHLEDYIIRAPDTGVLTDLPYLPGRYVKKGEYLAKVSITKQKKYIVNVDERQVYKIKVGHTARITSRQYNYLNFGYFKGRVIQVNELPVEKAGRYYYPVEVLVTEEPYNLKLGSGAEVMISTGRERIIVCLLGLDR